MKRFLSLAAILILLFSFCGCEEKSKFPKPTESFFVNDFANVIDADAEEQLLLACIELDEKTTAQVVVITVESLGDLPAYEYATEIGREWGIGQAEQDNGVVVLFSKGDREIFVAVGYGLEGALNDSKIGRIIDIYGLDYLKANQFSNGIKAITNTVINEVYIEYGVTPDGYTSIDNLPVKEGETNAGDVAVSWIVMIIIIIVFWVISSKTGGIFWLFNPFFGGRGRGGFGGFGGGSGGFGGFSGGGGSFGGGGAGRKF